MNGDGQTGRRPAGHVQIVAGNVRAEARVEVGGNSVAAFFIPLRRRIAVQFHRWRFLSEYGRSLRPRRRAPAPTDCRWKNRTRFLRRSPKLSALHTRKSPVSPNACCPRPYIFSLIIFFCLPFSGGCHVPWRNLFRSALSSCSVPLYSFFPAMQAPLPSPA